MFRGVPKKNTKTPKHQEAQALLHVNTYLPIYYRRQVSTVVFTRLAFCSFADERSREEKNPR